MVKTCTTSSRRCSRARPAPSRRRRASIRAFQGCRRARVSCSPVSRERVVVVDYGMGNLRSVARALAAAGSDPAVSADPAVVAGADRLVVPGVGAFGDAMEGLRARGLEAPIRGALAAGRPFLGICLGMQVLFD